MTKQEFLNIAKWVNETTLEAEIFSDFLRCTIRLHVGFNQLKTNRELSDIAIKSLNDFLNLEKINIDWIKNELWKVCKATFESASYGNSEHVKEGQSEVDANHELFGIFNKEDAFQKSKPVFVFIDNDNAWENK